MRQPLRKCGDTAGVSVPPIACLRCGYSVSDTKPSLSFEANNDPLPAHSQMRLEVDQCLKPSCELSAWAQGFCGLHGPNKSKRTRRDFYLLNLAVTCQTEKCRSTATVDLREKGKGSLGKYCLPCAQVRIRQMRLLDRDDIALVSKMRWAGLTPEQRNAQKQRDRRGADA